MQRYDFFLNLQVFSFFFRNFCYAELTLHSEIKRKSSFSFAILSFFRNFAIKIAKLLRLGIKKIKIFCSALDFS